MEIKKSSADVARNRKIDKAWDILCNELHIGEAIAENGEYVISASTINKVVRANYAEAYQENAPDARNLLKFDFSIDQPNVFRANKWSIMPIGHDQYKISNFKMYQELKYDIGKVQKKHFPDWIVGIDPKTLSSEPTAQAVADITGMIQIVMGTTEQPVATLSGKKGTGNLAFKIETYAKTQQTVRINGWQSEIDGLYETSDTALVVESKMKAPKDFNIRQLYIPTLIYKKMLEDRGIDKQLFAAYFIYSNNTFIFNLYQFKDLDVYNSLELIHQYHFKLTDSEVFSKTELSVLVTKQPVIGEPANDSEPIPFPQANNVYVMSDLLESLQAPTVTVDEDGEEISYPSGSMEAFVAQNKYTPRQADYYFNLLRYFGLADKNESNLVQSTSLGKEYVHAAGSGRVRVLATGMLKSGVFHELIDQQLQEGTPLTDEDVIRVMKAHLLRLSESTMKRRASTVRTLVGYIFDNLD